jgi:hypothetical protein
VRAARARIILASTCLLVASGCKPESSPAKRTPRKVDPAELHSDEAGEGAATPSEGGKGGERTHQAGVHAEIANTGGRCRVALCIGGPGEPTSGAHLALGDLCRRLGGVVRRCDGPACRSYWPAEDWEIGLEAAIQHMDTNADGRVDAQDPPCVVAVAGWSYGAVIATEELPAALLADERVAPERAQIDNLLAVVPHKPDGAALEIPERVRKAFVYRNTKAPEKDCSRAWEGGPWISPAPVCGAEHCYDYDYSLEPLLAFLSRSGARAGKEIGHCTIMEVVSRVVGFDNLAHGQEGFAEYVPRRADGTPGGRHRPEKHDADDPPRGPPPPEAEHPDPTPPKP